MAIKIVFGDNDLYTWCIKNGDLGQTLLKEYNDTLDLKTIGKGSSIKLKWRCSKCNHTWLADPQHRTTGRGCPDCRGNNKVGKDRLMINTNPELIDDWDFEANQGIEIDKISKSSNKRVWWKCNKCGYKWSAYVKNRTLNNSGCPECCKGNNISVREYAIYLILREHFDNVVSQYKINDMIFDIFIEDINTIIEYQGRYYHNNKFNEYDIESRDKDKKKYINEQGIRLITINETYGGDTALVDNDIYFDANNKNLKYICDTVINELNTILNTNISVSDDIETKVMSSMKLKDLNESLGSLYPELIDDWNIEKNGVLTPFKIKPKSNKKVWWKCSKCEHEWQTSPAHRVVDKTGCPKCVALSGSGSGTHMVITGVNDLKTLRPDIAKDWHTEKNNKIGIYVDNIREKSNKEAWWKCSACGHEYIDKIIYRTTRNHNCPLCNNVGIVNDTNKCLGEF